MAKKKIKKAKKKKTPAKKGTKRYDFKKVRPVDHDGNPLNFGPIHKAIGNAILRTTLTNEILDLSAKIHEGRPVDLTPDEIKSITRIIMNKRTGVIAVVRKALKEYIDSV